LAISGVGAFQQSGQSTQTPPKTENQDPNPVAITPRSIPTAAPISKEVTDGQFATFGYPSINNKGVIAFIGQFSPSSTPDKIGQAIFVREADGTWHFTRGKEKTLNDGWVMTGFNNLVINDNGDLAFLGSFADPAA